MGGGRDRQGSSPLSPGCDHLIQVLLHVLKDDVQFVVFSEDLLDFDDVRMLELGQRLGRGEIGRKHETRMINKFKNDKTSESINQETV